MFEEAIHSLLAIVDADIFPVQTRENTEPPYIVYQMISDVPDVVLAGASGVTQARVQIDCYADGYAAVKTLAEAVRSALDSYSGIVAGYVIQGIFKEDSSDSPEAPLHGEGRAVNRVTTDFMVWYQE